MDEVKSMKTYLSKRKGSVRVRVYVLEDQEGQGAEVLEKIRRLVINENRRSLRRDGFRISYEIVRMSSSSL